jgi:hypothetical protein
MPTLTIPSLTIATGVNEYGPLVLTQDWTRVDGSLDLDALPGQLWIELLFSDDGGQSWRTINKFDVITTTSPLVFSLRFGREIAGGRIKLTVTAPSPFASTGGTVTVQ